jgi:hypothetical protein
VRHYSIRTEESYVTSTTQSQALSAILFLLSPTFFKRHAGPRLELGMKREAA